MAALAALLVALEPASSLTVRVESPQPVTLVEVLDRTHELLEDEDLDTFITKTRGRPVCKAPCVATVPLASDYLIAGTGIVTSKPFSLAGHGDDVTLKVSPGSPLMKSLSRGAAVLALVLVGGGVLLVAWGTQGGTRPLQLGFGATSLTLGVGAGVLGLVLALVPARTRVHFE